MGGRFCTSGWAVTIAVLGPLLLALAACGPTRVAVDFEVPAHGFALNEASLPLDVMLLGPDPLERGLEKRLADQAERSKWFNGREPELLKLRDHLLNQGRLRRFEVTRDGRGLMPVDLSGVDDMEAAMILVVADLHNSNAPLAMRQVSDGPGFRIALEGNEVKLKPRL